MGGALASWQMFPARPRHSSSVNLRDAQVVPRRGAVYFPRAGTAGHLTCVNARIYACERAIRDGSRSAGLAGFLASRDRRG